MRRFSAASAGLALALITTPSTAITTTKPKPVTVVGPTGQRLTTNQATNLSADKQWITVTGKRYDETMGIIISLCVVPEVGKIPSPCGSGVDKLGITGTSRWVSSNPPIYGRGLAKEFGPGGSFQVTLKVSPHIGDFDCRKVKCAIATRGDMQNLDNRSVDVLIPVTFRADTKKK